MQAAQSQMWMLFLSILLAPKATKIDGYDGINSDSTHTDFIQVQNVDAISLVTSSSSVSSPSASPAFTPPSSPVNISRKSSVKSRKKSKGKGVDNVRKIDADHPPKRTKKKDGTKVKSDTKTVQRGKKKKKTAIADSSSDNECVVVSSVSSDTEPIMIKSSAEHLSDSEPGVMKSGIMNPSLTDSSSDNEPTVSWRKNVHINPLRYISVTSDLGGCTDFLTDNECSSDILSSSSSEVESSGSSSNTGKYLAPENFPGPS